MLAKKRHRSTVSPPDLAGILLPTFEVGKRGAVEPEVCFGGILSAFFLQLTKFPTDSLSLPVSKVLNSFRFHHGTSLALKASQGLY
jgi:hypothetical protein